MSSMPLILIIVVLGLLLALVLAYFAVKGGVSLARFLSQPALPRSVRQSLDESRRYGRLIVATSKRYPAGPIRNRLDLMLKPVDEWLAQLNKLEQSLQQMYGQYNLRRELRRASFEIEELKRRLRTAENDQEAGSLRKLLQSKQNRYAGLKELETFQTQAELKIHKIASDLGAAHAEMLLISARGDFNDNRLRRLDENLQEHVSGLKDLLAAMEEAGYRRGSAG